MMYKMKGRLKYWEDMSSIEKKKAYNIAIKSKNVIDTFKGFSRQMSTSIFDVITGLPYEI